MLDPVGKHGVNQLGKRELRVGVTSFFLNPGEVLEAGIQEAYVLGDDEALVLSALDYYEDDTSGKTSSILQYFINNSLWQKCHSSITRRDSPFTFSGRIKSLVPHLLHPPPPIIYTDISSKFIPLKPPLDK